MFIYTLVLVSEDPKDAYNAAWSRLSSYWDDEDGHVFRILELARIADQRVIVKVVTNAFYGQSYCDRTLNDWLVESSSRLTRRGDYISGDLVWWGGPLRD